MSKLLVVQRGHVARRSGAVGGTVGSRYAEQEHAIAVASLIVGMVRNIRGWTVRVIDADEPTARYAGDAFISLHCDSSESAAAGGASVGYRTAAGRRLAAAWKAAYARAGWPYGFRHDNYTTALARYYGTGRAATAGTPAAIIVEHGFLSNPTERAWIESPAGRYAAARAAVWAATGSDPDARGGAARTPTDPLEELMSSLSAPAAKRLTQFAEALADFDYDDPDMVGVTNGASFYRQTVKWHRILTRAGVSEADLRLLAGLKDGVDYMRPEGVGEARHYFTAGRSFAMAALALWREAGARGWRQSWSRFRENVPYGEEDL